MAYFALQCCLELESLFTIFIHGRKEIVEVARKESDMHSTIGSLVQGMSYAIMIVIEMSSFVQVCNPRYIVSWHRGGVIPLRAKRVGEFIEISHKKISPTHFFIKMTPTSIKF